LSFSVQSKRLRNRRHSVSLHFREVLLSHGVNDLLLVEDPLHEFEVRLVEEFANPPLFDI
jgi:hypothetical protein